MTPLPQLLTVEQAAAMLAVKPSWLYGRHHAGALPFPALKVGHYLRFRVEDLADYIDTQARQNGHREAQ